MLSDHLSVIYIMGYGRSGSTILDIILNNHPQIVSVGAASNLFSWAINDNDCACGNPISSCDFWGSIIRENYSNPSKLTEYRRQQLLIENHNNYHKLINNQLPEDLTINYGQIMTSLFNYLSEKSGNMIIVDSSKSAREVRGRAYALTKYTPLNVKLIHLVRDGRAVLWSILKGAGSPERPQTKNKTIRALRAIIGWTQANRVCLNIGQNLDSKPVLLMRYEDLVSDPIREINKLAGFINLEMQEVQSKLKSQSPLIVGHNLGGNRLRFDHKIDIVPDFEWKKKLPIRYRYLYWLLAWPITKRLNYNFID